MVRQPLVGKFPRAVGGWEFKLLLQAIFSAFYVDTMLICRMQLIRLAPVFFTAAILAADQPEKEFQLWSGKAPGQKGDTPADIPTLTPYWAAKPTGAAIVICPGGGYGGLAPHEGKGYADWLAAKGIHCFVLKYRLGSAGYRHPVMLQDISRAMRTVRFRAKDWEIDPQRIGVMGSSAGGHLASTIVAHFDAGDAKAEDLIDRVSSRPDAAILCYPVITTTIEKEQDAEE